MKMAYVAFVRFICLYRYLLIFNATQKFERLINMSWETSFENNQYQRNGFSDRTHDKLF